MHAHERAGGNAPARCAGEGKDAGGVTLSFAGRNRALIPAPDAIVRWHGSSRAKTRHCSAKVRPMPAVIRALVQDVADLQRVAGGAARRVEEDRQVCAARSPEEISKSLRRAGQELPFRGDPFVAARTAGVGRSLRHEEHHGPLVDLRERGGSVPRARAAPRLRRTAKAERCEQRSAQ